MYPFKREDNGEIVEVDFETMMAQDRAGFITLKDGVKARRVNQFTNAKPAVEKGNANMTPPPSDNLGFTVLQIAEFEEDRVRNGFTGVEFKQDPMCPEFVQVHFSSHAVRDKYIQHRGKVDRTRTKGATMTPGMLEDAVNMAKSHIQIKKLDKN